jgi:hypothetical protein
MSRVYLTTSGKQVTGKMVQTLSLLAAKPRRLSELTAEDVNRYHALNDKGLATIRGGFARPTNAGHELLNKVRALLSQPEPKGDKT